MTPQSLGPPADLTLGLGVGLPLANGAGCNLNRSIVTAASESPQVTVTADGRSYCVRVYDVGNLTGEVSFSISLLHP